VPSTTHECKGWDPSPDELRRLANELAKKLPDWSSTVDPSVTLDYTGLKEAAIWIASAPECVQWAVIEASAPLDRSASPSKNPMLPGMFLLMRVLFVLPNPDPSTYFRSDSWSRPEKKTGGWNYQWPVLVNPHEPILEIERCQGAPNSRAMYGALSEFAWFKLDRRFRMRTPAEIEALTIRGRP
jgi:hypothetical protein